eukprot:6208985-Pleurochrysis_carterae.AAC.4
MASTDILMCNDHCLRLLQHAHCAQAPVASTASGACCPLALAVLAADLILSHLHECLEHQMRTS